MILGIFSITCLFSLKNNSHKLYNPLLEKKHWDPTLMMRLYHLGVASVSVVEKETSAVKRRWGWGKEGSGTPNPCRAPSAKTDLKNNMFLATL